MIEKSYINTAIAMIAKPLADFLEEYLSMTDTKWWNRKVRPSFKDVRKIDNLKLRNLHKLNTCALLTIFSRNLELLAELARLHKHEVKNYVSECQTIRVRYAHPASDFEASDEELGRDFDTLYRLCKMIHAPKNILENLNECRKHFILKSFAPQEETKPVEAAEESVSAAKEITAPATDGIMNQGFFPIMQPIPTPVVMMNVNPAMMYGMMYNNFGVRF